MLSSGHFRQLGVPLTPKLDIGDPVTPGGRTMFLGVGGAHCPLPTGTARTLPRPSKLKHDVITRAWPMRNHGFPVACGTLFVSVSKPEASCWGYRKKIFTKDQWLFLSQTRVGLDSSRSVMFARVFKVDSLQAA